MTLADEEEGKVAFQQQCVSSTYVGRGDGKVVAVVDLLDEYWFFRNPLLVARTITQKPPSAAIRSCVDQTDDISSEADQLFSNSQPACGCRRGAPLLRLPTLPSQLTSLNSPYPKLRHSMSSLEYQSAASSSCKNTSHNLSFSGGERPARYVKLEKTERYRAILRYIARETYYRKTFTEKKWRSLSELEYMEVQGLRDLGFVFDVKEEGLINGQSNHKSSDEDGEVPVKKPYVSEAWPGPGPGPPMFTCFDSKSTQDMKDQLRFWAKAVASNTRHAF